MASPFAPSDASVVSLITEREATVGVECAKYSLEPPLDSVL